MDEGSERQALLWSHKGYRTAWLGGRLLAGIGWLLALLGVAGSLLAVWLRKDVETLVIGAASCASGLLLVVAGQTIRAAVEGAIRTREILGLLQAGPLQWATRPPPPQTPPTPPERSRSQSAWLKTPSTPISAEMRSSIASEDVRPCVNPFCERLLPEAAEVCPHCSTRQKRRTL
ncbi:hypothetical protein G3480_07125 [Thiorhodococcus mannitoliphagus]|uniref:Uncharacterized protein n=1 Tax=Thiorhodococcus mannitoliphagus TaxID=329406 RepID=A0A6P1DPZ4_9GAMM|nr:hypothetical protein [Thiorhodococcus mannitoliphagus]NEX20088.1 hypothetical protein [Thiorhodococcus mannitoliphagus]